MKALLWLLVCDVSAFIPPGKYSPEEFSDAESSRIDEMLSSKATPCGLTLKERKLRNLFFHLANVSVQLQNFRVTTPTCVSIDNTTNDLFAGRMDLSLSFPLLSLGGVISLCGGHTFRMHMRNVLGCGLCFTRWTEARLKVIGCDIRYRREGALSLLPADLPVEGCLLEGKTWRSLTTALTAGVVDELNRVLADVDVGKLAEPGMVDKYRGYVAESTRSANEFVDGLVAAVRSVIRDRYDDSFAIPDIEEGFKRKGLFITWRGSFKAEQGRVHGLATVSRVGDTAFASDSASRTHFFGNLSFENLRLHYDSYKAKFMNLGPSGTLEARLRPIRLHVHPFVDLTTGRVYLEDFAIDDVGDVEVKVTGLGVVLNWLTSRIASWVVGIVRDKILDDLQRRCDAYIRNVLDGHTLVEIESGRAFDRPG